MGTCVSICSGPAGAAVTSTDGGDQPQKQWPRDGSGGSSNDVTALPDGERRGWNSSISDGFAGRLSSGSMNMVKRLKYRSASVGNTGPDGKPRGLVRKESKKYFTATSSVVSTPASNRDKSLDDKSYTGPSSKDSMTLSQMEGDSMANGRLRTAARRMRRMSLAPANMGVGLMTVDSQIVDVFQGRVNQYDPVAGSRTSPIASGGAALVGVNSLGVGFDSPHGGPFRRTPTVPGSKRTSETGNPLSRETSPRMKPGGTNSPRSRRVRDKPEYMPPNGIHESSPSASGRSVRRAMPPPPIDVGIDPTQPVPSSAESRPPPTVAPTPGREEGRSSFDSVETDEAPLLPPLHRVCKESTFDDSTSPTAKLNSVLMAGHHTSHIGHRSSKKPMSTMSTVSGASGITQTASHTSVSTERTGSTGRDDPRPVIIGLSRDALHEHMSNMESNSVQSANSEQDLGSDSGRMQMEMVVRNRKRVSISASSAAESYVEDVDLPQNEPGSLAHIVFGEQQRMARMPEDELGGHLLAMEEASAKRVPLSMVIRGMLLNGSALAEPTTMHWVWKLKPGKVVRFFFSSTFTDTELERNLFLDDCVPFLRRVTALAGLEFQVSEMRWGINNVLSESHRTSSECMKELARCMESSTGLAFFGIVGDRYGYRPFPPVIEAELFEKLRGQIGKAAAETDVAMTGDLIDKWFELDTNTTPAVYRLAPIHVHLPSYIDMSPEGSEKRREAERVWWTQCFEPMQLALRKAAMKMLEDGIVSEQVADMFVRSVTEEEMMHGICYSKKRKTSGFWGNDVQASHRSALVIRNLVGIKEASWKDPAKAKFADKDNTRDADDEEAAELMSTLRERLVHEVPENRLFEFDVEWQEGGLDPAKHESHRMYLADLADTMCRLNMEELISQLSARPLVNDLEAEMMYHMHLCQKKSDTFAAREGMLDEIAKFFDDPDGPSTMMVVGQSGMGKSCLLAKAAMRLTKTLKARREATGKKPPVAPGLSWEEMKEDDSLMDADHPLVLLRFIGTTTKSMRAREIMQSCCQQITSYYSSLPEDIPAEYLALKDALPNSFARATKERPLYVILDALDQISDSAAGKNLDWLPMGAALPPHVKLLVSTLKVGTTRRAVTKRCGDSATILKLEGFQEGERELMLDEWLRRDGRQLAESQRNMLLRASNNDSSSLLLRMLYERSLEWKSTTTISQIGWVPTTAEDAINLLFDELEKVHCKELVQLVLGAITASKEGMSAAELEDLASSSDEVLLALFVWWAPPMARVPPLQVVRLLHDLESYLSETVGSGMNIVYQWAHRQFREQAEKRYMSDKEAVIKVHDGLAELFSGAKAKRHLPLQVHLLNGKIKHLPGDRRLPTQEPVLVRVAGEPVVYNERMLRELPHHFVAARRFQDLVDLLTDCEVFEYFATDSMNAVLAKLWRAILEAKVNRTPREEYMRMLDDLDEDVKQRKEAALARTVGEFLSTMLARLEDAEAFMKRAVSVSEAAGNQLDTAKGLDGVGKVLFYHGKYDESYIALERSLEIKRKELGDKSLEVATTMHFIADVMQKQSKLNEALRTYQSSCDIRKELQGHDSSDVAISLGCMGVLHKKLGDYQAALSHFEQSRQIFEMRLGKDNLTVAVAMMNIANLFKYLGKYEEAITTHLESIAIKKRILGTNSNHPEVAKSLGNLASVYEKVGRFDEAMEVNKECLEIQKKSLGPKSQDVARTLKGMGIILSEQGKLSDAVSVLNEALTITVGSVGRKHRDVVAILIVCADALYLQGFHDDALAKFGEAITTMRNILGNNRPHVDIAKGLRGLGNVYLSQGNEVEALKHFEEALNVYVAVVGKEHADSALCLDLVASTMIKMGKFDGALQKHLEAREWRKSTEAHSRDIAANLLYTGDVYSKQGEFSKALNDYNEALRLQSQGGSDTIVPAVAQTHNRLGIVYKKLGKYQEALQEYEMAKKVLLALFGANHLSLAVVNMNLGNVYQHLGQYELSLKNHLESLEVKKKFLGDNNIEVATSLGNMATVLERLGRLDEAMDMFRMCLEIQQSKQNGRSLEVARTLRGMGAVQRAQGLYDESIQSYNDAREITIDCVGSNHLDVAQIALATAGVLVKQKLEIPKAEEMFLEAIKITKDLVGEDHQIIALAMRGLGDVHCESGKIELAIKSYQKSTAITRTLVGSLDNLDMAATKYNMSLALRRMGKNDEAEQNRKDAERVFLSVLGPDHPWTLRAKTCDGESL